MASSCDYVVHPRAQRRTSRAVRTVLRTLWFTAACAVCAAHAALGVSAVALVLLFFPAILDVLHIILESECRPAAGRRPAGCEDAPRGRRVSADLLEDDCALGVGCR